MKNKHWYDYLWIWSIVYFTLGFFNILFAWLGMIDFILPLVIAVVGGNKAFCNQYCGRGQLFALIGGKMKCSRKKATPKWMSSKWFRYGFLLYFPDNVWKYDFSNLAGWKRCKKFKRSGKIVLDD